MSSKKKSGIELDPDEIEKEIRNLIKDPQGAICLGFDTFTLYYESLVAKYADLFLIREISSKGHKKEYYVLQPRDYQPINRQAYRLVRDMLKSDLNIVGICQMKDKWEDMKVTGVTFDGPKRLSYLFDTIIEINKDPKTDKWIAKAEKDRSNILKEGHVYDWSTEEKIYELMKPFEIVSGHAAIPVFVQLESPVDRTELLLEIKDLKTRLKIDGKEEWDKLLVPYGVATAKEMDLDALKRFKDSLEARDRGDLVEEAPPPPAPAQSSVAEPPVVTPPAPSGDGTLPWDAVPDSPPAEEKATAEGLRPELSPEHSAHTIASFWNLKEIGLDKFAKDNRPEILQYKGDVRQAWIDKWAKIKGTDYYLNSEGPDLEPLNDVVSSDVNGDIIHCDKRQNRTYVKTCQARKCTDMASCQSYQAWEALKNPPAPPAADKAESVTNTAPEVSDDLPFTDYPFAGKSKDDLLKEFVIPLKQELRIINRDEWSKLLEPYKVKTATELTVEQVVTFVKQLQTLRPTSTQTA